LLKIQPSVDAKYAIKGELLELLDQIVSFDDVIKYATIKDIIDYLKDAFAPEVIDYLDAQINFNGVLAKAGFEPDTVKLETMIKEKTADVPLPDDEDGDDYPPDVED
jgi:hypothetical protein